jgi:outer membrane protein TolC
MILRRCVAIVLCYTSMLSFTWAQELSIVPVRPHAPFVVRPYLAPEVPPVRLQNSARLQSLIRGGILYLTAQDAIALALENNIDIEVARYNPIVAAWNLERAEAGGALPGVPSGASQAGAVASGQGVAGSQAAAGVSTTGAGGNAGGTANATISQIGPVTQNLDPAIQETTAFSHTTSPQPNLTQSLTPVLISATHSYSGSYQQGFLSGGNVTLSYTEHYLFENSPTDILNPSVAPNLSITAQHNLLRGFGTAVGGRTITISKINLKTSDIVFKTQVIAIVANVLSLYYGLAADYEDVKAKRGALEVAQKLYEDNKEQVRVGSLAPLDLTKAEALVASSEQNLVVSDTTRQQQEVQLKNLLSRNGTADPALRTVQIIPLDKIEIPAKEDLPPLGDMVRQALANRTDIATEKANFEAAEVSALGTINGILPNLVVFGAESHAGLAGTRRLVVSPRGTLTADPYFDGGIGNALDQIFRRNFPTERIGTFFQTPIHNWQAQADYGVDQLQLRQTRLQDQKDANQVEVDVLNSVVGLRQARARYDAAVHNRVLNQQLLEAEQRKYSLGASVPYNVIVQQRDLTNAQAAELAALVSYSDARVTLDRTLGTTLEANHISVREALAGTVARPSELPTVLPQQP